MSALAASSRSAIQKLGGGLITWTACACFASAGWAAGLAGPDESPLKPPPTPLPIGGHPDVMERTQVAGMRITQEYVIGPVDLPAHTRHAHHAPLASDGAGGTPAPWWLRSEAPAVEVRRESDAWLTDFSAEVIDRNGRPLPGTLLCHTALYTPEPGLPAGSQVIAWSGGELAHTALPPGIGLFLPKQQPLQLASLFRNPLDQDFHETFLRVTLRLRRDDPAMPMRAAKAVWFTVYLSDAGDPTYLVPPGHDLRRRRVAFPFAGTVVSMIGHLHAPYGVLVQLTDVGTGAARWSARALLSADGLSLTMPSWRPQDNFHVSPGDSYEVSAEYLNRSHEPFDAMGVMGAFVVPDE